MRFPAMLLADTDAPRPKPRVITFGAENLLGPQARAIREIFGVDPVQPYGLAEMVANASQCPEGRLHIDQDFAAVKLVPTGDGAYRVVGDPDALSKRSKGDRKTFWN